MKEILEFIRVLIEKYGFRSIIAFILMILCITLTPEDIIGLLPFESNNKYWIMALYFAIFIVIETLFLFLGRKIKNKISYSKYKNESIEENNKKALENLWSLIDTLSESERTEIRGFLKSTNIPIPKRGFSLGYSNYSTLLVEMEKRTEIKEKVTFADTGKEGILKAQCTHIYKLKDDVYELIKYSYEKHGKICHFE